MANFNAHLLPPPPLFPFAAPTFCTGEKKKEEERYPSSRRAKKGGGEAEVSGGIKKLVGPKREELSEGERRKVPDIVFSRSNRAAGGRRTEGQGLELHV